MLSSFQAFFFGALGSVLIELIDVLSYYRRGKFPQRYSEPLFWMSRVALVIGSGFVAYAHDVQTKILAMHLGAATRLIIQAFAGTNPIGKDEERGAG